MKLLPKALRASLPPLYSTESVPTEEKIIRVKFFTPDSSWTWYAVEGSPVNAAGEALTGPCAPSDADVTTQAADFLFFGLVDGLEREWGYFSLRELTTLRGLMGLPVERDLHFGTPTVGELLSKEARA